MAGRSPRRVGQGLGGPHSPNGFARQATSLTKSFCLLVRVFAKPRGPARPVARLRPQSSRIRRAARSASGCNVGLRSPQSRGRSGSVDERKRAIVARQRLVEPTEFFQNDTAIGAALCGLSRIASWYAAIASCRWPASRKAFPRLL